MIDMLNQNFSGLKTLYRIDGKNLICKIIIGDRVTHTISLNRDTHFITSTVIDIITANSSDFNNYPDYLDDDSNECYD